MSAVQLQAVMDGEGGDYQRVKDFLVEARRVRKSVVALFDGSGQSRSKRRFLLHTARQAR